MSAYKEIPAGDESILLIDDDKQIVQMIQFRLEHLGYKVTGIIGAIAGLENYKKNPQDYDLILTDMTMPEMTGEMIAEEVFKISPELPIIIITGYSDAIADGISKCENVRQILMKPIIISDLAVAMREALKTQKH